MATSYDPAKGRFLTLAEEAAKRKESTSGTSQPQAHAAAEAEAQRVERAMAENKQRLTRRSGKGRRRTTKTRKGKKRYTRRR